MVMRSIDELVPPIKNDNSKQVTIDNEVVANMVQEMSHVVKESLDSQRIAVDNMTEVLKNSIKPNEQNEPND